MIEPIQRTKELSIERGEEQSRTHLLKFLQDNDRFSSADQLSDLMRIGVRQSELCHVTKPKIKRASQHQRSNNEQTVVDLRQQPTSPSRSKRRYCARWISDQQQTSLLPTEVEQGNDIRIVSSGKCKVISDLNYILLLIAGLLLGESLTKQRARRANVFVFIRTDVQYFGRSIPGISFFFLFFWNIQRSSKKANQGFDRSYPLLHFVLNYVQQLTNVSIKTNHSSPLLLMNIFAARCFLDLFDNETSLDRIKMFVQKQLEKMHIPFIEHLTITDLNLGDRLPQIQVTLRQSEMHCR